MVLVFDLDDTLYDEITFVDSGFRAVSKYLHDTHDVCKQKSFSFMLDHLRDHGRGKVFDELLTMIGLHSKKNVKACLFVYRTHKPKIKLFDDAQRCLLRCKDLPRYIVTDGNKCVQKSKITCLGLYNQMKFCYVTHQHGIHNAKPSPYCFLKICEREKVPPGQVFYIGDNPNKDFVGIKPLGFKTIRILRGHYKDLVLSNQYEADYSINSLDFLTNDFLSNCMKKRRVNKCQT